MPKRVNKKKKGLLLLQDGSVFEGWTLGAAETQMGELVFHTAYTGYQEILSDPSYFRQILCFTSPQIGNQGVHPDDLESDRMWASACIMRAYSEAPTHWRKKWSFEDYLVSQKRPALFGVDTRRLVLRIREAGNLWGVLSTETTSEKDLKKYFENELQMEGLALASEVSTKSSYTWMTGSTDLLSPDWKQTKKSGRCVVFDFGVKRQILRYLIDSGFQEVIVVPAKTSAEEVLSLAPDLVFLSNGPGDPAALTDVIPEIRKLVNKLPMFGICLGHQILALALGYATYKLKFGHHAANHPVSSSLSERVEITSQNHGFAVRNDQKIQSICSHLNLNDQSVEGFVDPELRVCGIQYHPESSPGPLDSVRIFKAVYDSEIFQMRTAS